MTKLPLTSTLIAAMILTGVLVAATISRADTGTPGSSPSPIATVSPSASPAASPQATQAPSQPVTNSPESPQTQAVTESPTIGTGEPQVAPTASPSPTPTPEATVVSATRCYVTMPEPTPSNPNQAWYEYYTMQTMSDGSVVPQGGGVVSGSTEGYPQCPNNQPLY